MLRSRSFWTLFGSYAALVLLAAGVIGSLTLAEVRHSLRQSSHDYLQAQCDLLGSQCDLLRLPAAGDFSDQDRAELTTTLGSAAKRNRLRVTLIQRDGTVLWDTDQQAGTIENRRGRPEVQEALKGGYGSDIRRDRTTGQLHSYVAHSPAGDRSGVIRVSQSTHMVDVHVSRAVRKVLAGTAIAAGLALLLGWLVAGWLVRPLAAIGGAATAFEQGDFEVKIRNLPRGELGDLGQALNRMGVEIHARMRELEKDEGQLRAMLAGMGEGVLAVDEQDRVSFSNAAARQLFDLSQVRVDGQRLWELVRVPGLHELMGMARSSDEAAHRELGLNRNGIELTCLAKAHRFVTDEEIGVVLVFEDITELRRLERVRQDFVANVSHELKTPLTSIRGYVETLMDGALHDEDNNLRFLEKIDQNVKRLGALVVDLLSLARIEEREVSMPRTRVDVRTVLNGVLRRAEEELRAKEIQVELDLPAGPCAVLANEEGMIQVMENLIGNAIKYTREAGRIWIDFATNNDRALISVRDNGVGIPPEDLERIFERFYRVDKARSRDVGGTGLGLSIVKHLVHSMGGDVKVSSVFGAGSSFEVDLLGTD